MQNMKQRGTLTNRKTYMRLTSNHIASGSQPISDEKEITPTNNYLEERIWDRFVGVCATYSTFHTVFEETYQKYIRILREKIK